jgi:hypothetical protein
MSQPQPQPVGEIAGLHAALSYAGVPMLRGPGQPQEPCQQQDMLRGPGQPQEPCQQQDMLRGPGQPQEPCQQQDMLSPLLSGFQQHIHPTGSRQQAAQADPIAASPTSASLGQVGSELHMISARLQSMHRSSAQQQQPSSSSALLSGYGEFTTHTACTATAYSVTLLAVHRCCSCRNTALSPFLALPLAQGLLASAATAAVGPALCHSHHCRYSNGILRPVITTIALLLS